MVGRKMWPISSLIIFTAVLTAVSGYENRRSNSQSLPKPPEATDAEVSDLITSLRDLDSAKLSIKPNYQGHTFSNQKADKSPNPLFPTLTPSQVNSKVYQSLRFLYDNFEPSTGVAETTTPVEEAEIDSFLNAVLNTPVLQKTREFLNRKRYAPAVSNSTFKAHLKSLWFDTYSRAKGRQDTSAFEHIFIGELKNNEVQGMHNWYRFYYLEQSGAIDYKGFIIKRNNFAMVQFEWLRTWKPTGSFLIGTSPEFDLSLYTLCFLTKPGTKRCKFSIDGEPLGVTSHPLVQNDKTFIGSVYPTPA